MMFTLSAGNNCILFNCNVTVSGITPTVVVDVVQKSEDSICTFRPAISIVKLLSVVCALPIA